MAFKYVEALPSKKISVRPFIVAMGSGYVVIYFL